MVRGLIVLAVLAAAVLVTRPRPSADAVGFRGWRWLAAGYGVQFLWMHLIAPHTPGPTLLWWIPVGAMMLVLHFLWLNRERRGSLLVAIGGGANVVAMMGNGGLMPIAPITLQHLAGLSARHLASLPLSKGRILSDAAARFPALDDRFLWSINGLHIAASVGDLLIVIGCVLIVWGEFRRKPDVVPPGSTVVPHRKASGIWSAIVSSETFV